MGLSAACLYNLLVDFDTRSYRIRSKLIEVKGEVNMSSAPKLREKILEAFQKKPQVVVVDLSKVTYMDSAGVAVLVEGIQWARQEKVIFSLREPSKAARSVLEVARVDKLFNFAGDVPPAPE